VADRSNGADLTLGVLASRASAAICTKRRRFPRSLLEDAVGARGVPLAIGWMMAALGAVLCVRGLLGSRNDERSIGGRPCANGSRCRCAAAHLQALGLLAILAAYVALLPYAGYVAPTALLIAAVAWFLRRDAKLAAAGDRIAGSVFLWVMFDPMLSIRFPPEPWWESR
jgi:hypothetical protein